MNLFCVWTIANDLFIMFNSMIFGTNTTFVLYVSRPLRFFSRGLVKNVTFFFPRSREKRISGVLLCYGPTGPAASFVICDSICSLLVSNLLVGVLLLPEVGFRVVSISKITSISRLFQSWHSCTCEASDQWMCCVTSGRLLSANQCSLWNGRKMDKTVNSAPR